MQKNLNILIQVQNYQRSHKLFMHNFFKHWLEHINMANKPFDKRENKDKSKAFAKTKKEVKPVAKDTNKTRRPGMAKMKEVK
jgi:hypothetical protein